MLYPLPASFGHFTFEFSIVREIAKSIPAGVLASAKLSIPDGVLYAAPAPAAAPQPPPPIPTAAASIIVEEISINVVACKQ